VISFLIGENNFEVTRTLKRLIAEFDGEVEQIDGSELTAQQLPDLLMGATLFSAKRLVVIKGLAENKSVWNEFESWIGRVSDDVHLVLIEPKPDKRTKTYKALSKAASVQEFPAWTERDMLRAEAWVVEEAKSQQLELDKKSAQLLVERVGVDQWQLYYAIQKLTALGQASPAIIREVIEANPVENVFNLLDAALKGDRARVSDMVRTLTQTDDPYMVFGLLSSQVFQLAALAVSGKPSTEVAKDIGAHPYALSKLAPHASKLGRGGAKRIIDVFAATDTAMKSTATDPWLLVERALLKVAH
jgi:DNA polymerase III, delta subunit